MSTPRRPGPRIPGVPQLPQPHPAGVEPPPPSQSASVPPEPARVAPTPAPGAAVDLVRASAWSAETPTPPSAQDTSPKPAHTEAPLPPDRNAERRASRRSGALAVDAVDMNGARRQQFNAYVDDRLKSHYDRLVFELKGALQGGTNLSEFVRALLEEGPATAEDARALILRSRARHQQS